VAEYGLGNNLLWHHEVLSTFQATLGSDFYDICSAGGLRAYLGFDQDLYIRLFHHRPETYILSTSASLIFSLIFVVFLDHSPLVNLFYINILAGSRCITILSSQLPFWLSPTSWQATAQLSQQLVTKAALALLSAVSPHT
jgi:hypothetical protein